MSNPTWEIGDRVAIVDRIGNPVATGQVAGMREVDGTWFYDITSGPGRRYACLLETELGRLGNA